VTFTDSDRFLVFAFSVSQLLSTLNIRQSADLTIVLSPETCERQTSLLSTCCRYNGTFTWYTERMDMLVYNFR